MPDGPDASPEFRDRYPSSNWWGDAVILVLFSAFYFTVTSVRSGSKFLWFDELCTLDICRLPSFAASWQAVLHGADYNPPLFYLIERATLGALGEGLIALRIPSILGVWVFCLSMFAVVRRRTGRLGGAVAMLFPLCTIAGYYACEMRPHAIVLGFCGLSIFCWQRAERPLHFLAFAIWLTAAFLTHCYAILIATPFAVMELSRTVERRRIRFAPWLAIGIPLLIAFTVYLPLLAAYRHTLADTGFAYMFRTGFWQIHFYDLLVFTPFIGVLLTAALLLTLHRPGSLPICRHELLFYVTFALLPFVAVMLATIVHGPFIARYFLSAIAGFAALLGLAFGTRRGKTWVPCVFLVVMCVAQGRDLGTLLARHYVGAGETLEEPAIHIPVNTTPGKPLADHRLVVDRTPGDLSIVVAEPMDFLYLVHYAPQLSARLHYVAWSSKETNYRLYENVRVWCHETYNPATTYGEFLRHQTAFYVYGDWLNMSRLSELVQAGAKVNSFASDEHHWLAAVTR